MSEQKNLYMITLAVLFAGLVLGWVIHSVVQKPQALSEVSGVNVELELFKERVKRSGVLRTEPTVLRGLSGVIKNINTDAFSIEQAQPMYLFEPELDNRLVKINDQTRFLIFYPRDAKILETEVAKWRKSLPVKGNPNDYPPAPSLYTIKPGSISDLQPGIGVRVSARENIATSTEFVAITVEISVPQIPDEYPVVEAPPAVSPKQ